MGFASAIYGQANMTAGHATTTSGGDGGDNGDDGNGDDNEDDGDDGENDSGRRTIQLAYLGNYASSKFGKCNFRPWKPYHFFFYIYFTYS